VEVHPATRRWTSRDTSDYQSSHACTRQTPSRCDSPPSTPDVDYARFEVTAASSLSWRRVRGRPPRRMCGRVIVMRRRPAPLASSLSTCGSVAPRAAGRQGDTARACLTRPPPWSRARRLWSAAVLVSARVEGVDVRGCRTGSPGVSGALRSVCLTHGTKMPFD